MRKSVNSAYLLILASLLIHSGGCTAMKPPVRDGQTPWSTHFFNAARINHSPDPVAAPMKVLWAKDVSPVDVFRPYPREELSSPAVSGAAVFIAGSNETLYSLDLASGRTNWRYSAGYPLEAPLTVTDDGVCFGSGNGALICLDRNTGKELWRFQARSEILSSPVVADNRVYFYSSDDRLHSVDMRTGEKLWSYSRPTFRTVSPRPRASPAYSAPKGRLFQVFSDGFLVCLLADTGKELWAKRVIKDTERAQTGRSTPLVSDGLVYLKDGSGAVLSFDEANGEQREAYNMLRARDFLIVNRRTLVIAGEETVVALDRISGSILWKRDLRRPALSSLLSSGDTLFVLSNHKTAPLGIKYLGKEKGYVEAIALKDGSTLWEKRLYSTVSSNGAVSQNRLAVFTDRGVVEIFSSR